MRRSLGICLLATAVAACKKEPEDTGPKGSCGDIETTPLASIAVDDWPDNLDAELDPYRALPGVYDAESCAGTITVKLDTFPAVEDLQVITTSVDPKLPCGCNTDPEFPDADNALGATTYAYAATAYFDSPDDTLDPAMDSRLFNVDWAFFPSGAPFLMRACAVVPIDDSTGTAGWSTAKAALRVDTSGFLSGTLTLSGSGDPWTCDLSGFVFVNSNG